MGTSVSIPGLVSGSVGDCIFVLTRPEVRSAGQLETTTTFHTADGTVIGRPGDVVITAHSGESYPIRNEVFLGAYKILGSVGHDTVAERLVHVRRAWPVVSDGAVFDYGADRGKVPVARGGWCYQSDDNDYGVINRDQKLKGHVEVGPETTLNAYQWTRRYDAATAALASLPPALALLALLAFSSAGLYETLSRGLIALEMVLLLGGVATVVRLERGNWLLKSCVAAALTLCRRFQIVVRMLGERTSTDFPGMSLWRAAQSDAGASALLSPDPRNESGDEALHGEISATLEMLSARARGCRLRERLVSFGTVATVVAVFAIGGYTFWVRDSGGVELFAIWLPSVISAAHSFNFRRRTTERRAAMEEFMLQLKFVQARLLEPSPAGAGSHAEAQRRAAALRLLCRLVGQFNQREIQFALVNEAPVPV